MKKNAPRVDWRSTARLRLEAFDAERASHARTLKALRVAVKFIRDTRDPEVAEKARGVIRAITAIRRGRKA